MSREFRKYKCLQTGVTVVTRPLVQTANPESVNWPEYVIFERWDPDTKIMEKVMIHWQNVPRYVEKHKSSGVYGVLLESRGGYAQLSGKVIFAGARYWSDTGTLCKVATTGSAVPLVEVIWPGMEKRHSSALMGEPFCN